MSSKNLGFLSILLVTLSGFTFRMPSLLEKTTHTIMLDPAGDAKYAGRTIDDSFERGITLQFSEQLKKIIEERYANIRIVLTRIPGETLEPLQNANFANRLGIALYLSVHFYYDPQAKPSVYIYHFLYHPTTDLWATASSALSFKPYDQAHKAKSTISKDWATVVKEILEQNPSSKPFEVKGVYGIPFKPLIGITAPALSIEICLRTKDDWHHYVEPISRGLAAVIEQFGRS